ncbi:hypothetical protein FRB93_007301 [Tulasnella sp. JGI-2019a]|nr:hypothetical protein FRB93_007301 [Tulasnella sp. JGI-2019a]
MTVRRTRRQPQPVCVENVEPIWNEAQLLVQVRYLTENDLSLPFVPGGSAIRQNCTFSASLCCSLLAAVGAVLAKQWPQSYERTGQTGPLDQQAIRRTEKFVGAEKWGLRRVVEALATLLLISLALFFVALVNYLWTVNETVAIVVLGFAAAGGLFYLLIITLTAIFSACPYQTGPSAGLRQPYLLLQRLIYSPNIKWLWIQNTPFRDDIDTIYRWLAPQDTWHPIRIVAHLAPLIFFILIIIIFFSIPTYIVFGLIIPLLRWLIPPHDELNMRNMDSLHAYSAILMA